MSLFTRYKTYVLNAGIYLLASLIPSLLSVLINPLLAINMDPADYAVVAYYTSFNSLLTPLAVFFMIDYYCRRYYVLNGEEREILKANILKMFVFYSGAVCLISLGGLFIFVRATDVSFDFMPYALLAIAQIYVSIPYTFQLAEYKIAADGKNYFRVSVFWGVVSVVLTLLFVVVLKDGGRGKLFSAFLASVFPCACYLWKSRKSLLIPMNKDLVKDILKYGFPLTLAALLSFFTNGYDKVLLERNGDVESLGYYSVACHMSGYLSIFAAALKSTFQPDMYKAISHKNIKKVLLAAGGVIGVVSVIVLLYIVFCPWIIKILTAGRYMASTHLSQITALSILTSTIYYQISQLTYGTGHSNITLINKIIGVVLSIGLLYFMINGYGAEGAAWGMTISYLVYAVGNVILLLFVRKDLFI